MKRRGFLGGILAACAAPAVITRAGVLMPVRNMLLPPQEVIMLTSRGNSLITPEMIARESLKILSEQLTFTAAINAEWEQNASGRVFIRKPSRFVK